MSKTVQIEYPAGPVYDYLWNWAWQIGIACATTNGRISVWGHAQSLMMFMQTWREWYGEPQGYRVLSAASVEHCGIEMNLPAHAFVRLNPATTKGPR